MGAILGILETLLAAYSVRLTLISYSVLAGIAFVCAIFIQEDLRKTNFARRAKIDSKEIENLRAKVGTFKLGKMMNTTPDEEMD